MVRRRLCRSGAAGAAARLAAGATSMSTGAQSWLWSTWLSGGPSLWSGSG